MKEDFQQGSYYTNTEAAVLSSLIDNNGIESVLSAATVLEKEGKIEEAMVYCRTVHKILLGQDRADLVGDVMLLQAQIQDRQGEGMNRDLFAIEAASSFYEHGRLKHAEMALNLIPQ